MSAPTPRASDLPPRPNPATGRPLPPPAPGTDGPRVFELPVRPQAPPPGRGPLFVGRSGFSLRAVVLVVVVLVAGVGAVSLAVGLAPDSAAAWSVLAIIAVAAGALVYAFTGTYLAAGADWLADERAWVDLYDLAAIEGSTRWGRPTLRFTHGDGRRVTAGVRELRAVPAMWDSVPLGTRWSRASRAVDVDPVAARTLGEDPPPSS